MYMKTKELDWKVTQGIQNILIKDSQGNRIVEQSQVLKILGELYYRTTLQLTVRTEPLYVVLIYLSEWLHVSALIRPSSGHKYII